MPFYQVFYTLQQKTTNNILAICRKKVNYFFRLFFSFIFFHLFSFFYLFFKNIFIYFHFFYFFIVFIYFFYLKSCDFSKKELYFIENFLILIDKMVFYRVYSIKKRKKRPFCRESRPAYALLSVCYWEKYIACRPDMCYTVGTSIDAGKTRRRRRRVLPRGPKRKIERI